jgi:hypothetical protein
VPPEIVTPLLRTALCGWCGFVEATSLEWVAHRAVARDELVALLTAVLFDAVMRTTGIAAARKGTKVRPAAG